MTTKKNKNSESTELGNEILPNQEVDNSRQREESMRESNSLYSIEKAIRTNFRAIAGILPEIAENERIVMHLSDVDNTTIANDFFVEEFGKNATEYDVQAFEELKIPLTVLREKFNLEINDLFQDNPYKKAKRKGMKEMGRLVRAYDEIGTARAEDRVKLKNMEMIKESSSVNEEQLYIEKLRAKGLAEDLIAKKVKSRQAMLNHQMKDPNYAKAGKIMPSIQQEKSGVKQSERLQTEIKERVDNNFFDWYGYYLNYTHQMYKSLHDTGTLVITNGIKDDLYDIENSEKLTGKPALLKGDLGSGKTEKAIYVGKKSNTLNKANIIQKYTEIGINVVSLKEISKQFAVLKGNTTEYNKLVDDYLLTQQKNHPVISDFAKDDAVLWLQENTDDVFNFYRHNLISTKNILDEELALFPIVVSGHKEFDPSELVGGFEIKPSEINLAKLKDTFFQEKAVIESLPISDEEKSDLKKLTMDKLSQTSIETAAYLGRIFQAMSLGKTIIIDEVNAIPHEVFIILNHYATRKVGDIVQPPVNNLDPITIQPGYKLILTGNFPKDGQTGYTGRQAFDAAARSRYNEIEIDYPENCREDNFKLPDDLDKKVKNNLMSTDLAWQEYYASLDNEKRAIIRHGGIMETEGGKEKLFGKENNELFHILVTFGLNRSLVAKLPENYFDKLSALAKGARLIQDAYSGKEVDAKYYQSIGAKPSSFLKYAVPSMRDLLTIIKAWSSQGYARDIDYYLWKYFIQKFPENKNEQEFIYTVFKSHGFFDNKEVFSDNPKKLSSLNLKGDLVKNNKVPRNETKFKTFGQQEILEKMYGVAPVVTESDQAIIDSANTPVENLEESKDALITEIDRLTIEMEAWLADYQERIMDKYCAGVC